MTPYALKQKADEFGISFHNAAKIRIRYLTQQINQCCDWIMEEADMPQVMACEAIEELEAINRVLQAPAHSKFAAVTEDMVSQARSVRVDSIIEFNHGKRRAWCHDDANPSLFYGSKLNIAVCPVCDKKFDSITVQMHWYNQSFKEAVIALCQR